MVALAGPLHLFKKNVVLKVNIQFFSSFLDGFLTCVSLIEHLRERERKKRGTYRRKQGEVVMDVEAFEMEPISGQSNDGLFIFCFLYIILLAILFVAVVSYLYLLFRSYLNSLA